LKSLRERVRLRPARVRLRTTVPAAHCSKLYL
jgi:hypothetical protein